MNLFIYLVIFTLTLSYCFAKSTTNSNNNITPNNFPQEISCRDENGNKVPWFIAYKLPKIRQAIKPIIRSGTAYSYILPDSSRWIESSYSIGAANSLIGETLKPFFKNLDNPELLSIIYNDQPSYRSDFGYNGHAKGIILGNANNGIWLVHSVPKFPSVPPAGFKGSHYDFYPKSGHNNAQLFLCLSLKPADINNIGNIFTLTRPHINNSTLPLKLGKTYPAIKTFLETKRFNQNSLNSEPLNQIFNLKLTLAGKRKDLNFHIFAKSPKFDHEIYSEWLAPTLRSSLDVQSWLNGVNAFQSNCTSTQFPVYNIQDKKISASGSGDIGFGRNDHSKWAVGSEKEDPWICVSDLNRMNGQKSRGGAALCFSDRNAWSAFNSAVIDLQPCDLLPTKSG